MVKKLNTHPKENSFFVLFFFFSAIPDGLGFWIAKLDNLIWNLDKVWTDFKTSMKIHLFRLTYCIINTCSPNHCWLEVLVCMARVRTHIECGCEPTGLVGFRELKNRKCSNVIRNGWRYWASELSWKEKTSYNLEACTFCFALESKTGEIEFQGCKYSPLKQARAFYRLCVHYGSELLYQGPQKWYNGVGVVSKV